MRAWRSETRGNSDTTAVCADRICFQAEDGIRDKLVTGVQTCALPICRSCAGWHKYLITPMSRCLPLFNRSPCWLNPAGKWASQSKTKIIERPEEPLQRWIEAGERSSWSLQQATSPCTD